MDYAYAAIIGDREGAYSIGRADRGIKGYTPQPQRGTYPTYDEASVAAEEINATELGLEPYEAFKIVASTMFP
jgi:hypothetical protein